MARALDFQFRASGDARLAITDRLCRMKKPNTANTDHAPVTIGQLAKAASVGVETIRYYQRRGLLPVPKPQGATRYYAPSLIDRIGFIKRAQTLGFSLDEVAALLYLEDGRNRRAVLVVATARLTQVRSKLSDLRRMQRVLNELVERCEATADPHPCPIIEALVGRSCARTGSPAVGTT